MIRLTAATKLGPSILEPNLYLLARQLQLLRQLIEQHPVGIMSVVVEDVLERAGLEAGEVVAISSLRLLRALAALRLTVDILAQQAVRERVAAINATVGDIIRRAISAESHSRVRLRCRLTEARLVDDGTRRH